MQDDDNKRLVEDVISSSSPSTLIEQVILFFPISHAFPASFLPFPPTFSLRFRFSLLFPFSFSFLLLSSVFWPTQCLIISRDIFSAVPPPTHPGSAANGDEISGHPHLNPSLPTKPIDRLSDEIGNVFPPPIVRS